MQNSFKIAISLPKKDYIEIEKIRKKTGLARSAIIDQAIRFWLKRKNIDKMIRRYEAGYKKKPESMQETRAMERAAAEAFQEEGLK